MKEDVPIPFEDTHAQDVCANCGALFEEHHKGLTGVCKKFKEKERENSKEKFVLMPDGKTLIPKDKHDKSVEEVRKFKKKSNSKEEK